MCDKIENWKSDSPSSKKVISMESVDHKECILTEANGSSVNIESLNLKDLPENSSEIKSESNPIKYINGDGFDILNNEFCGSQRYEVCEIKNKSQPRITIDITTSTEVHNNDFEVKEENSSSSAESLEILSLEEFLKIGSDELGDSSYCGTCCCHFEERPSYIMDLEQPNSQLEEFRDCNTCDLHCSTIEVLKSVTHPTDETEKTTVDCIRLQESIEDDTDEEFQYEEFELPTFLDDLIFSLRRSEKRDNLTQDDDEDLSDEDFLCKDDDEEFDQDDDYDEELLYNAISTNSNNILSNCENDVNKEDRDVSTKSDDSISGDNSTNTNNDDSINRDNSINASNDDGSDEQFASSSLKAPTARISIDDGSRKALWDKICSIRDSYNSSNSDVCFDEKLNSFDGKFGKSTLRPPTMKSYSSLRSKSPAVRRRNKDCHRTFRAKTPAKISSGIEKVVNEEKILNTPILSQKFDLRDNEDDSENKFDVSKDGLISSLLRGIFEQSADSEPILTTIEKIRKYCHSNQSNERREVPSLVWQWFQEATISDLNRYGLEIMGILAKLGEEDRIADRTRHEEASLLERIPYIASQAAECSCKAPILSNATSQYLLPIVVRNLGVTDSNIIGLRAQRALLHFLEHKLITLPQVEIQVCPTILALSKDIKCTSEQNNKNLGIIALMGKMIPYVGKDITERIFLKRFTELCSSEIFYIRKSCVSIIKEFCAVVSENTFEKTLLPCYLELCRDSNAAVRRCCAEATRYVSKVSSSTARREHLTPVYLSFLQDEDRWVRIAAFDNLGYFIVTFADPSVLQTMKNDDNDQLIEPDASMLEFAPKPRNYNYLESRFNENFNNTDFENNEKACSIDNTDGWIPLVKTQNVAQTPPLMRHMPVIRDDSCQNTTPVSDIDLYNEFDVPKSDNLEDFLEEMKETVMNMKLDMSDIVGEIKQKNEDCNSNILEEKKLQNEAVGMRQEIKNNNLEYIAQNKSNLKSEDEDLHLFNSYNYWYISPDLPIDHEVVDNKNTFNTTNIREGNMEEKEENTTPNIKSNKVENNKVNKVSSCEIDLKTETNNSDENEGNHKNSASEEERETEDQEDEVLPEVEEKQHIVPQALLDYFVSMTTNNYAVDLSEHCAFTLPAVALTLGGDNWDLLKDTVNQLASDGQYRIRKMIAASLYQFASILGPEKATTNLLPLFDDFLKDLDEVRIEILKRLSKFLGSISAEKRSSYLPKLAQFLKMDQTRNWRFREELASQLNSSLPLFKPNDVFKYVGTIALSLLCDNIAAVRQSAIALTAHLIEYTSNESELNSRLLIKLAECFAHSKNWRSRQVFASLCCEILSIEALELDRFASEVMPHLLDLSWDPVANVRLVVAKAISRYILVEEYFTDPCNGHYMSLESVLQRLRADKDRDVREAAEIEEC